MTRFLLSLSAALVFPLVAAAQTGPALDSPVEDEVIVEGQRQGADAAMDAFLRGDYVTAEIEFEKNFSTLKRREALRVSSIEQNVSDAIGGQINEGAGTNSGANAAGADAGDTNALGSPIIYVNKRDKRKDPNKISSGTDIGAQLYMAGLSELKQGKLDEAKVSFERSLSFNKGLHDSRYRLGLIALGTGEPEEARRQLGKLERALKGCHARCERMGDREILETGVRELRRFLGES